MKITTYCPNFLALLIAHHPMIASVAAPSHMRAVCHHRKRLTSLTSVVFTSTGCSTMRSRQRVSMRAIWLTACSVCHRSMRMVSPLIIVVTLSRIISVSWVWMCCTDTMLSRSCNTTGTSCVMYRVLHPVSKVMHKQMSMAAMMAKIAIQASPMFFWL